MPGHTGGERNALFSLEMMLNSLHLSNLDTGKDMKNACHAVLC